MKIYIIMTFDEMKKEQFHGDYVHGDSEIAFICKRKKEAKKIIAENTMDFADCAWKYCALIESKTNRYSPQFEYDKITYYKHNYDIAKWELVEVNECT